jgi:pilus assembly protein CpaB
MRTKIILVLAIIMGLITTLLFYKYMTQFDQEIVISEESLIEVIVASKEIPKNQRITEEFIEKISISKTGIHEQAYVNETEALGKYATAAIAAGEQILSHRVSVEKEESLYISRKIKEGYRASSVGVNFVQSVSNMIEPEDYVDVIFSEVDPVTELIESELLLQKVHVLAVGRKMIEPVQGEAYVEYSSATLELTVQDAVKLANAAQRGTIHLILHSRIKEREGTGNAK